ncbi:hypothetical protein [Bacillus solitudinis]|nr:hypothetical protein [Bacillus solitudinis]
MTIKNLYHELVNECRTKLDRELTKKEMELIQWIQENQIESLYQQVKSS